MKQFGGDDAVAQQLQCYGKTCVEPGLQYFTAKFTQKLAGSIGTYKAARLFVPQKVTEIQPDAAAIDALTSSPFLSSPRDCDKPEI